MVHSGRIIPYLSPIVNPEREMSSDQRRATSREDGDKGRANGRRETPRRYDGGGPHERNQDGGRDHEEAEAREADRSQENHGSDQRE